MIVDVQGNIVSDGDYIPYQHEWENFTVSLEQNELDDLKKLYVDKINKMLSSGTAPVVETAWVVGSDWRGTEFMPIYYAAKESEVQAGYFAGLLLWVVLAEDDREWVMWEDPKNGCRQYFLQHY